MAPEESHAVSRLAVDVFNRFVAPGCGKKACNMFVAYVTPSRIERGVDDGNRVWVAKAGGCIVGVIEVRDDTHIAMLFVAPDWQGQGIARRLVAKARAHVIEKQPRKRRLTVNAASGAVGAYRRLGFSARTAQQKKDGIVYTPMICPLRTPESS